MCFQPITNFALLVWWDPKLNYFLLEICALEDIKKSSLVFFLTMKEKERDDNL